MTARIHRRRLLTAAAGGALAAALPLASCGRAPNAAALPAIRINDDFSVIAASGGNVLAARGADGVVLVDGGFAEEAPSVLASVAEAFPRAPIAALVDSHWRRNVTGLNETLGKRGVKIVAHENTKQWLAHEVFVRWENKTYEPLPEVALPTETFYADARLPFGDAEIELGHLLQAHTDGDVYVRFPAANVLATGGAITNDAWPLLDWWTGGYIGGLLDAFTTLLAIADDATIIAPGSGPVMTRAELQAQNDMYLEVFERLATLLKDSMSPAEAVAARPTQGFKEEWGDPDLFVELAFRSFYGHLRGNTRLGPMP
jgi:glyoxylase-like metal-dependent hydrolase (beta-lactamase superfamily II)